MSGCSEMSSLYSTPQRTFYALEHALDHLRIAAHRNALETVVEIIVVIGEAAWQAFDDAGGQIFAVASPLLLGVALHELFKDIAANERQCLLFKIRGLFDIFLSYLLGDFRLRLGGVKTPQSLLNVFMLKGMLYVSPLIKATGSSRSC